MSSLVAEDVAVSRYSKINGPRYSTILISGIHWVAGCHVRVTGRERTETADRLNSTQTALLVKLRKEIQNNNKHWLNWKLTAYITEQTVRTQKHKEGMMMTWRKTGETEDLNRNQGYHGNRHNWGKEGAGEQNHSMEESKSEHNTHRKRDYQNKRGRLRHMNLTGQSKHKDKTD